MSEVNNISNSASELSGEITLPSGNTNIKIEIIDNQVCLHFPEEVDTSNWYHAVMIKCDLESSEIDV